MEGKIPSVFYGAEIMEKRDILYYVVFAGLFAILVMYTKNSAEASVSSCSASVSPHTLVRNTSGDFNFTLTNTESDSVNYNWIKIRRPGESDLWSINSASASNWDENVSENEVTFTGGNLDPSESLNITINVTADDTSDSSPRSWVFEVSDDGGNDRFSCDGSLNATITEPAGDDPPSMSDITISNITSSSVTLSWTTNEGTTALIEYGVTDSYGSSKSDSSSSTSHSVTIDGLSADTSYHFNTKSTDSGNNTVESGDNIFITAAAGLTSEVQTITVETVTTTTEIITPSPTPTPIPDTTPPYIVIKTDLTKPFEQSPLISGTATDNSGISKIEYSFDDGKNWLAVDSISTLYGRSTTFEFVLPSLEDDNYKLKIRAQDAAPRRNMGMTKVQTLVIDRLPPQVAGTVIAVGPQTLYPGKNGAVVTSTGVEQTMYLSSVGGATAIDLFILQGEATISSKFVSLKKNLENGFWSGILTFDKPGTYRLKAHSTDGAGNKTERILNSIQVIEPGRVVDSHKKPIKNATVSLHLLENSGNWVLWDARAFDQKNPITTNTAGEFQELVTPGKYYFTIKAAGFQDAVSEIFIVEEPIVLNPTFTLSESPVFDLLLFKIPLPDFTPQTLPVELKRGKSVETEDLTGQEAPVFTLPTVEGEEFNSSTLGGNASVITFLDSKNPAASEQILILDEVNQDNFQTALILLGESPSKSLIFKKRGEYTSLILVDQDATLVKDYMVDTVPSHYFLDRRGTVRNIVRGVMSADEIETELTNISN